MRFQMTTSKQTSTKSRSASKQTTKTSHVQAPDCMSYTVFQNWSSATSSSCLKELMIPIKAYDTRHKPATILSAHLISSLSAGIMQWMFLAFCSLQAHFGKKHAGEKGKARQLVSPYSAMSFDGSFLGRA